MRGGSVGRAAEAAQQQSGNGGQFCGGVAAQGQRKQRSGGVGCGGSSLAVAGSGAAGRRQRRRQSGGGGGSTALELARWQRRRRRQPNHPCHGAADSAINCSRTAWRCSSVPLRTEGRRRIAGGITTSRRSSWAFLAGKNKFDQENSYETFCGDNVPEKPLRTHRDKPSSIISALSVATMGIFP
jgi:hypothetical protein